jgi:hypothetical protein
MVAAVEGMGVAVEVMAEGTEVAGTAAMGATAFMAVGRTVPITGVTVGGGDGDGHPPGDGAPGVVAGRTTIGRRTTTGPRTSRFLRTNRCFRTGSLPASSSAATAVESTPCSEPSNGSDGVF